MSRGAQDQNATVTPAPQARRRRALLDFSKPEFGEESVRQGSGEKTKKYDRTQYVIENTGWRCENEPKTNPN